MVATSSGDPATERLAAWRALDPDLLPIWHRHIASLGLADALFESGDRDEAAAILERVRNKASVDGTARVARWAAELAEQAGLSASSPGAARGDSTIAALTPRERQVLELVAEGLTNPQIGRRLYISPKTASVHVSAILAKIGASNRAEAAALFAASGA
jgi:DNA-binding NarL/FixJ family response regulator